MLKMRWTMRIIGLSFLTNLFYVVPASAVPSFARQTGMACEACHTVFPELNHFGRMFKANGFTLDNLNQVRGITPLKQEMLDLSGLPPLSIMLLISDTQLSKSLPDGTGAAGHSQTDTVGFPQQLGIFYAGKIAPHLGGMIQLTYSNSAGGINIDNTDVRFADNVILPHETNLVYGVSLNNNPTVQDLWNSTPAWGFPYASSNANVSPLAHAEIDGVLAQDVAGLTAYVMWNEALYAELGVYKSAKQGVTNPITGAAGPLDGTASNVMKNTAPYFRVAYEYQWSRNSLEVGAYGATFKLYPGGGSTTAPALLSGPNNEFKDVAEDFQYQFIADEHLFSVSGTRIHESMTLDASFAAGASANQRNTLTTLRANANYYFRRKYGGTVSFFSTTGSTDTLLYPNGPAPGVVTSANGDPQSRGWIAELNYLPWLNVKLSLQYTAYEKFNGGNTNYDGFNRNASNNDTTYFLLWLAF
jgi:hypothetical protein